MEFKDTLLVFYIILTAKYFENFFSCDLQRLFTYNVVAKHLLAFISAFFLITLVSEDTKEAKNIGVLFLTTAKIYILYIMSTKAKAVFVLPMIILLFLDQIIKVQVEILGRRLKEAGKTEDDKLKKQHKVLQQVRNVLTYLIVLLIVGGLVHYYVRARMEFGTDFSHTKFFLGTRRCANMNPPAGE